MISKVPKQILLFLILIWVSVSADAQTENRSYSSLNDRLYNGKVYSYYPPTDVVGTQFINDEIFSMSTVWIEGEAFKDILLNYDILNQEVLLSFKDAQGAQKIIALSMAYVDSFYYEQKLFVIIRDNDDGTKIYQRIKSQSFQFYFLWHKNLNLQTSLNIIKYEFSKPLRKIYFVYDGKKNAVSNNRSLIKLFSKKHQTVLRKYMRSHKMKLGKMNDSQFLELLTYIDNLQSE